jgi:elongator complex protein 2
MLAYSFTGALHSWHLGDGGQWRPGVTVGGHFGPVEDLDWDPRGRYLVTTSKDQTTRIHAPWKADSQLWHEVARPQVNVVSITEFFLSITIISGIIFNNFR